MPSPKWCPFLLSIKKFYSIGWDVLSETCNDFITWFACHSGITWLEALKMRHAKRSRFGHKYLIIDYAVYLFSKLPASKLWGFFCELKYEQCFFVSNIFCDKMSYYIGRWWYHELKTPSTLQAPCEGELPTMGRLSSQRSVMRNLIVFISEI